VKGARHLFVGLLVTLLAFLGVSAFAIWQDGMRFARVEEQNQPAPTGIAAASYLDASRLQWKTADQLHEYAREHRLELIDRMEEHGTP
jgi:uncharacterized oligopeptide transporter (OPT) family protein